MMTRSFLVDPQEHQGIRQAQTIFQPFSAPSARVSVLGQEYLSYTSIQAVRENRERGKGEKEIEKEWGVNFITANKVNMQKKTTIVFFQETETKKGRHSVLCANQLQFTIATHYLTWLTSVPSCTCNLRTNNRSTSGKSMPLDLLIHRALANAMMSLASLTQCTFLITVPGLALLGIKFKGHEPRP